MTSVVNEKRIRNLSTISFDSENVDQENPKTQGNEEKGQDIGTNMTGFTEIGLKSNTCVVCDRNDNWVLICHEEKCPLAIHQSCMTDEPDFDEFGNFYCPYCWYKRVDLKLAKLRKKLMVTNCSRKGRETLVGVDLGLIMDKETRDIENVLEVNVSESRTLASVNRDGKRTEGDGSYNKFMAIEKDQRMREVAAQTQSSENSEAHDADLSERRRLSETTHEISDACTSNAAEGIKLKAKCCEKIHPEVQVRNSDEGEKRKPQRGSDVMNHETAPAHSIDAGVKKGKQRRYSEKSRQKSRVAGARRQDVFINDEATQSHDFDLGEGRSGQGCYHENNQQTKVSYTESCEQEVPTDKRVLHGSGKGEGKYRERSHSEKNQHTEAVETENLEELSNDRKRKREGVKRGGDECYFAENQDRQDQGDMKIDGVAFNEQMNDFRKDEQGDRNSISFVSSPVSSDNVNESNATSQELALIIHPKAGVQERPREAQPFYYVSSKKPSFQPEKYGHKSYLEKNGTVSNDPGQRKFVSCSDRKRKRRFWTQAEEEMLRVGVQKFPVGRNIPWHKILEFGRDVFHDERVPSDLKDKWKTMNKTSFDTSKWVSLSTERQPNYYVSEVTSE